MRRTSPYIVYLIVWILLVAGSFLSSEFFLDVIDFWDLVVALNAGTFLLVGIDKFQAGRAIRVPEYLFYLATIVGGSIGMLLGMHAFRHKTRKTSFQLVLHILVLIQVAVIVWDLSRSSNFDTLLGL